jgi:hypothetical protein
MYTKNHKVFVVIANSPTARLTDIQIRVFLLSLGQDAIPISAGDWGYAVAAPWMGRADELMAKVVGAIGFRA